MTDSTNADETETDGIVPNDDDAANQRTKALRVVSFEGLTQTCCCLVLTRGPLLTVALVGRSLQDSTISISVDMEITFRNGRDDDDDSAEHTGEIEPDADSVFSTAAQGLLEGLSAAMQLSDASHLAQHGGDLQFLLDQEPPPQNNDRHGTTLGFRKKKEKASKSTAHMVKNGNSRSSSRASSRAASRFGGAGGSTTASLRQSVLAIKLAKLLFQTSPLSKPASDPFHIISWDESSISSEVQSHTSASHKTHSPGMRSKIGSESGDSTYKQQEQWGNRTDNSARGPLCTASTSRVPFDFKEAQRREEIASDLDACETRQRIAREVHRKGDLKLKLRSLADPTISLEKEEALAMSLLARKGSTRGGFRPLARDDSVLVTTLPVAATSLNRSPPRPSVVHPGLQQISRSSAANLAIPENSITFRKEDYDGLQSDVVMLDHNGELLVGKNCFLIAKKPRQDLLLNLFQKSTVEPRVQLPSSQVPLQQESPPTISATGESSGSPTANKNQVDRQSQSRKSPTHASISRNSPLGRRVSSNVLQDTLFDGQRGTFESFPKLELDPKKTTLTKGVTLKVDEATKRKLSVVKSKAQAANPGIQETQSNDPLENQLKAKMLKSTEKQQRRQNDLRKPSFHQLSSRIDPSADPLSDGQQQQQSSPDQSKPEANDNRPQSKHHHQSLKDVRNSRTRTPALRYRMSRKALLKPELSEFDGSDLEFGEDHLYSLHESGGPTSLPKVKKSSYQREFPSPPNGRINIVSAAKASALTSSTAGALPFPFTTLPTVLKGRR